MLQVTKEKTAARQEVGKGCGSDHLEDESRRASDHAAGAPARRGRRRAPADQRTWKRVREVVEHARPECVPPWCLPAASPLRPRRGNLR